MSHQEEALTQEIIADARRRADRIKQRAERDARKVMDEARKAAQAEREGLLQVAARRAEHERQVSRGRLEQDLARLRLQVRQDLVQRVRAEAERRLAELAAGADHREVLVKLALLAVEAMSGERFELVLCPRDRQRWGEELAAEVRDAVQGRLGRDARVELSEETLSSAGGLVVRGADGHEVADQSFEARLDRLWERICIEVAAMLPDLPGTDE